MSQEDIFATEGDAWFRRNKHMLTPERPADVCTQYLLALPLEGKHILEVGASNGWRLKRLADKTGASCFGTDISQQAVDDGNARFSGITLSKAPSHDLSQFEDASFDLMLVSFVFHWVDRSRLLQTVKEIDRVLKEGGLLVIQDFDPLEPYRTAYHHLPDKDVFTYKQPYWDLFSVSHLYMEETRIQFSHDEPTVSASASLNDDDSCAMVSLRKTRIGNYPLRERK